MIDTLLKGLNKDKLQDHLNSLGIPSEKTEAAVNLAAGTVENTFKNKAREGNLDNLLDLFNGKKAIGSSSLVTEVVEKYAGQLASKLGIQADIASSAAKMLIPMLFSQLDSNTSESGFTTDQLKQVVGNDLMSGLGGKLKGIF